MNLLEPLLTKFENWADTMCGGNSPVKLTLAYLYITRGWAVLETRADPEQCSRPEDTTHYPVSSRGLGHPLLSSLNPPDDPDISFVTKKAGATYSGTTGAT